MGPKSKKLAPGEVLDAKTRDRLGLEVVSRDARSKLTRLLRRSVRAHHQSEEADQIEMIRMNRAVNLANAAMGRGVYPLEPDQYGYYQAVEYGWHQGEMELALRRPDVAQLIEILVDLASASILQVRDVNAVLSADGVGVRLVEGDDERDVEVELVDLSELPELSADAADHPNVRLLIERMDRAFQDEDLPLVLLSGASIFDTLAKEMVANPAVHNQSLGGWFALYRKQSHMAGPMLDEAERIFKLRNVQPLAGHGSIDKPNVTKQEAVFIREFAVAFVRMERQLAALSAAAPSFPKAAGKSAKFSQPIKPGQAAKPKQATKPASAAAPVKPKPHPIAPRKKPAPSKAPRPTIKLPPASTSRPAARRDA